MTTDPSAAGHDAPFHGRLLIDPPGDAAWNMAVDQALLESVAAGGPPTLRFYRWQRPTLSLGYFQSTADRGQHPASRALPVVRRASGGGAIVHDAELTYSVAVPLSGRQRLSVQVLYDQLHRAICRCLAMLRIAASRFADSGRPAPLGPPPFLCFQRRTADDLVVAGYKVVGSAQRRTTGAVLQHGSILLHASRFAPELPGIVDLTGQACAAESLQRLLAEAIPAVDQHGLLPAAWIAGDLTAQEQQRAAQIVQERFAHPNWTDRRSGARP